VAFFFFYFVFWHKPVSYEKQVFVCRRTLVADRSEVLLPTAELDGSLTSRLDQNGETAFKLFVELSVKDVSDFAIDDVPLQLFLVFFVFAVFVNQQFP